jgi:hypothetical protein
MGKMASKTAISSCFCCLNKLFLLSSSLSSPLLESALSCALFSPTEYSERTLGQFWTQSLKAQQLLVFRLWNPVSELYGSLCYPTRDLTTWRGLGGLAVGERGHMENRSTSQTYKLNVYVNTYMIIYMYTNIQWEREQDVLVGISEGMTGGGRRNENVRE